MKEDDGEFSDHVTERVGETVSDPVSVTVAERDEVELFGIEIVVDIVVVVVPVSG